MKKIKLLLASLAMMLLLTGCVKINYDVKINNDKSMDLKIVYAPAKDVEMRVDDENGVVEIEDGIEIEDGEEEEVFSEEKIQKLKDKGWDVESYEDDKYAGLTLHKKIANIDDCLLDERKPVDILTVVDDAFDEKFFYKNGDVYYADWTMDLEDAEQVRSMLDLKLKVSLEKEVIETNSESTDQKVLEWDMTKAETAKFAFEFPRSNSEILLSVLGSLALTAGIIAMLILLKK